MAINAFGFDLPGTDMGGTTSLESETDAKTEQRRKMAQAQLDQAKSNQTDLVGQSQNYRARIPAMKDVAGGAIGDSERQNFARQLASNNSSAQGRGLLYSGLKQQADQNSAADYSNALSSRMMGMNNGFNQQANQMDQSAYKQGMNLYENQAAASDQAYKNALAKQGQNAQQTGQLMSGAGSVIGLLAAG